MERSAGVSPAGGGYPRIGRMMRMDPPGSCGREGRVRTPGAVRGIWPPPTRIIPPHPECIPVDDAGGACVSPARVRSRSRLRSRSRSRERRRKWGGRPARQSWGQGMVRLPRAPRSGPNSREVVGACGIRDRDRKPPTARRDSPLPHHGLKVTQVGSKSRSRVRFGFARADRGAGRVRGHSPGRRRPYAPPGVRADPTRSWSRGERAWR